jgi:predicted PhzF superfamily epimerase YddE/YHI9
MPAPPVFHVDAFTREPFQGNPAAVVLLDTPVDDAWMQAIAAEMNLSETAFAWPTAGGFGLRWFTPLAEVDLCGHATLATAHVLWAERRAAEDTSLTFHTASGPLTCRAVGGAVQLDFPIDVPERVAEPPAPLLAGLGEPAIEVWHGRFDYLVRLEAASFVAGLQPDLAAIAAVGGRGVCVTAPGAPGSGVDFVSRFFGPAVGIAEDPVTGSAHCMLAPYWAPILGRDTFAARQLSRRGGELAVEIHADRVLLTGYAVTVARGTLTQFPA